MLWSSLGQNGVQAGIWRTLPFLMSELADNSSLDPLHELTQNHHFAECEVGISPILTHFPSFQSSENKALMIQLDEERDDNEELSNILRSVAQPKVIDTEQEEGVEQDMKATREKLTVSWLLFTACNCCGYIRTLHGYTLHSSCLLCG